MATFDPVARQVVRVFSRSLWMNEQEEWFIPNPEALKARNGEFFFGSASGLLQFHPDSIRIDSIPPQVALTSIHLSDRLLRPGPDAILDRHIAYTKQIELKHFQNDLTLGLAALHFKSPEDNRFRYRLVNFDSGWRDAGTHNSADYTNLPPGRYIFQLQAANSDHFWSEPVDLLGIKIRPPWYANPVAYGLYFLLLVILLFLLYRDLLRRRLAKAEITRQQEINRFKSRFYTNITHEFRTPLTLILSTAESLEEKTQTDIPKGMRLIRKHGQNLLRLINQMLELSKLESQSLSVNPVQSDIIPFIKGVVGEFDSAARQKDIQLSHQCHSDRLLMDFDPEHLQMVLANLLSNALKFTPAGGRVEVKTACEQDGGYNWLVVSVTDTGRGIPEKHLPFIFDRFYQVSVPQKPSEEPEIFSTGTGIGLALAKELTERMGGWIKVASQPDRGAAFKVGLPVRQNASVAQPPPAPDGAAASRPQEAVYRTAPLFPVQTNVELPLLLIVEDNPDMTAFLIDFLQDAYRVQTAPDGQAGLQKALAEVPDIVLSDIMMPKMDGLEFCRRLKSDVRTSHIPIVLLTARAGREHRLEGLELGADAYLTKPFDRKELLIRLEQLIKTRQVLRKRYENMRRIAPGEPSPFQREDAFIKKVQEIILENLDEPAFQVNDLCRELGMSRTQVHNKLKALTGRSARLYLRSLRLHEARKLLINTSLSISEIAYRVGFKGGSHFSTSFKEEFGLSPSSFRSQPF